MPELRKDPIIGRWVIIATERGKRPSDFVNEAETIKGGFCPLCPGNEDKTPPEIYVIRPENSKPNTPDWSLRVVKNKFPALVPDQKLERVRKGIFERMSGVGDHEIVIETPRHNAKLSDLQVEQVENILWAYRERIRDMKTDSRFRYAMVFKNYGTAAGASLEHSHSQLIALPIVPKRVFEEMEGARNYYNYRDRCIFCDIIRQEIREEIRIIEENGEIIALAPFASRFPFETWILPKDHSPSFEEMGDYKGLAQILLTILNKMDRILDNPPYNFVIHTSQFRDSYNEYYHWHLEIMPKLTKVAGFEWGTGFYINPTPPEDAAKSFREVPL